MGNGWGGGYPTGPDMVISMLADGISPIGNLPANLGPLQSLGAAILATKRGADLGNIDATIAPGSDGASQYILPASTLTANRVITLADTAAVQFQAVEIVRFDTSAFTLTIKNAVGATLVVQPGLVRSSTIYTFVTGSHFIYGQIRFLA